MLAFHQPLASEGVSRDQVGLFEGARGRFQGALLNGDLDGAERALEEMKRISPNGNTYRVSAMALRASPIMDLQALTFVYGTGMYLPR